MLSQRHFTPLLGVAILSASHGCARTQTAAQAPSELPSPSAASAQPTDAWSNPSMVQGYPEATDTPSWRADCGPGLPRARELEIELTQVTSKACWFGRVLASGASVAGWSAGAEVCLRASDPDRWDRFETGGVVYVVPVERSDTLLEAHLTCYYVPETRRLDAEPLTRP